MDKSTTVRGQVKGSVRNRAKGSVRNGAKGSVVRAVLSCAIAVAIGPTDHIVSYREKEPWPDIDTIELFLDPVKFQRVQWKYPDAIQYPFPGTPQPRGRYYDWPPSPPKPR